MNATDLVTDAVSNSVRSRTRTVLTASAIVVGAFTLTLTSAVGAGGNEFIAKTVSSIGGTDLLTVTKAVPDDTEGPQPYRPESQTVAIDQVGTGPDDVQVLRDADLNRLRDIDGVLSVDPRLSVALDYVSVAGGSKYEASLGGLVSGMRVDLAAGQQLEQSAGQYQISLPDSYVAPLGFASSQDAVGKTFQLGFTTAAGQTRTETAVIRAVAYPPAITAAGLTANDALTDALWTAQYDGVPTADRNVYGSATVRFDPALGAEHLTTLQAVIATAGYTSQTVPQQLGTIQTIMNVVVVVLIGFAIVALLAAGFGIVNTMLTNVQERTREIGLLKALGLSGRKVFGLFSVEAAFIGLLGSAIGAAGAIGAGAIVNAVLAGGLLEALPGLTLLVFQPLTVGAIVLGVVGIAFLAGTIPAVVAARKNPIDALRYE